MIWIIGLSVAALFAAPFLAAVSRRRQMPVFIYDPGLRTWIPAEQWRLERERGNK